MRFGRWSRFVFAASCGFVLLAIAAVLGCDQLIVHPQLRFVPVRTYESSHLPWRESEAWSPDGEHFVLLGDDRFGIASVRDSSARIETWYQHLPFQSAWSPRGGVLAISVLRGPRRDALDDFLVTSNGGHHPIAQAVPMHELFWLDDGMLCARQTADGQIVVLYSDTSQSRPGGVRRPVLLGSMPRGFGVGSEPALVITPVGPTSGGAAADSVLPGYTIRPLAPPVPYDFGIRSRASGLTLAHRVDAKWGDFLLDESGRVLKELPRHRRPMDFQRTTLFADGQFVLGYDNAFDDVLPAPTRLWAEPLDGGRPSPVEGGTACRHVAASCRGDWVLVEDGEGPNVRLGHIERLTAVKR